MLIGLYVVCRSLASNLINVRMARLTNNRINPLFDSLSLHSLAGFGYLV